MKKKMFLILITGLLIFALAGCTTANKPTATAEVQNTPVPTEVEADTDHDDADTDMEDTDEADTDTEEDAPTIDAAALYTENCAKCHGQNREGGGGPSLLPSRLTKDPSAYVERINEGSGPMPAFSGTLSVEEIDALVEFILTEPQ
jgi:cytochrome c551